MSLSHVCNTEDEGEKHAEGSHNDVAHRQEVVLSTKGIRRGQHEVFLSLEWGYFELIADLELVLASLQVSVNSSPQFAEVWQTSCSHPDNEVL